MKVRAWKGGAVLSIAVYGLAVLAAVAAEAADVYDINAVLPLTGRASFVGKSGQQALQLAEKVINKEGGIQGRPVHFVIHDDQSSPQTAVQLTNKILTAHPPVILGSMIVGMCSAMAPLMQNGPVQYCFSPGVHPAPGSYSFTAGVSTRDQAAALIRYFRMKGWKRLALLTSTDATGQDAERGILEVLKLSENKDVKLVENAHFNPTEVSVSAQIEQVKASQPQAFIAWTTGATLGTVLKGVAQAGLDVPIGTTSGNVSYQGIAQFAGVLPKELYLPAGLGSARGSNLKLDPAVEKRRKVYYDAFSAAGAQPDNGSEMVWDETMIVVDTLRKLGLNATSAQIRDSIAHLKGYAGVSGIFDFEETPQRGLSMRNVVVTRWNPEQKIFEAMSQPGGAPAGQTQAK